MPELNLFAFPSDNAAIDKGMTLRDYFAAAFMQGLTCCRGSLAIEKETAIVAYEMADKMLEEREK